MRPFLLFITAALLGGMLAGCTNSNKQTEEKYMKQKFNDKPNDANVEQNLAQEWDKVFPLSEKVNHKKVTFKTQYGLTLAADLYTPAASEKLKDKSESQGIMFFA